MGDDVLGRPGAVCYDSTNDTEATVKIVDAELPALTSFKYLGSIFTSEGCSQADVTNVIRIGWKEVSGVMCDKKMPVELKDKVFKTIIGPAMTYGSECWAVKKKDVNNLNPSEMRMMRWEKGRPGWITSELKTSGRRRT